MKRSYLTCLLLLGLFIGPKMMSAQVEKKLVKLYTWDGNRIDGILKKSSSDSSVFIQQVSQWDDTSSAMQVPVSKIRSIEFTAKPKNLFKRTAIGFGGGLVLGALGAGALADEENGIFRVSEDDFGRMVLWGAGIGAVVGIITNLFSKNTTDYIFTNRKQKLSIKQKRKLNSVSF